MLPIIKKLIVLIFFPCLIFSCTFAQDGKEQKRKLTDSITNNNTISELTLEQESAFDALNTLQVSTDEKNRLYSTFAGIAQPCYPPDTSIVITRSELLIAMKKFVSNNCKRLTVERQNELAAFSVLAQEEYKVLHCRDNSINENYEKGLPDTGIWVMPNVLGRRDVILVW